MIGPKLYVNFMIEGRFKPEMICPTFYPLPHPDSSEDYKGSSRDMCIWASVLPFPPKKLAVAAFTP